MQKAIIYCRVSSERQVNEGHGLESQERLCLSYAKSKNYQVIKIFKEQGISGSLFDRPEMRKVLSFLDEYKFNNQKEFIILSLLDFRPAQLSQLVVDVILLQEQKAPVCCWDKLKKLSKQNRISKLLVNNLALKYILAKKEIFYYSKGP